MEQHHFLLLGLDSLRADMVTPDTTPNLLRFAEQGGVFSPPSRYLFAGDTG